MSAPVPPLGLSPPAGISPPAATAFAEILLLEPDAADAAEFAENAAPAGVSCSLAPTIEDAVGMLRAKPFDGIVHSLDPARSLAAVRRLRREFPALALVVISRRAAFAAILKALGYGASSYADKPVSSSDIAWLVRRGMRVRPKPL